MEQNQSALISGRILPSLVRFALPILLALFLQTLYGAADLLIVGQFSDSINVSAVSTGSQLMQSITTAITSFSTGATVLIARKVGEGKHKEAGDVIGAAIWIYGVLAVLLTAIVVGLASPIAKLLQAPAEAFSQTVTYLSICGSGLLFIIAYNVIGAVFRGLGDSNTPLITVAIASVINILGDLLLVGALHMGAAGAAIATISAQLISVIVSLLIVRRRKNDISVTKHSLSPKLDSFRPNIKKILDIGIPVGLQDALTSVSFLVILALVNSLGVTYSAGIGVAEKVCGFIMLLPIAFMQALTAFVGQNQGAGEEERSRKALYISMGLSFAASVILAYLAFFHGTFFAGLFSKDAAVIAAAADYLKAYALDVLIVCFVFCFNGYFSGCGRTKFVMAVGLIGAFGVRIPVSWFMRNQSPVSLFKIGLAAPSSSAVQIVLCLVYFFILLRAVKKETAVKTETNE